MQSENTADLATALAKAQAQMKAIPFDRTNPHFKSKYASLASVIETVRKPLADNGLSYTQTMEIREGGLVLVTTLRHGGQWIASEYPLPMAAKPQELGAALTYARRYSLSAIACIAADDDDDAEGTNHQTSSTPKAKQSPVQPQNVAAPVHPETGEVGPHMIVAPNDLAWGAAYVASIKAAGSRAEVELWAKLNAGALEALPEKIAVRVEANVNEKLATFSQMIAAE